VTLNEPFPTRSLSKIKDATPGQPLRPRPTGIIHCDGGANYRPASQFRAIIPIRAVQPPADPRISFYWHLP
jgi:hypothetical protein